MEKTKVLVLGSTGMLGNAMMVELPKYGFEVICPSKVLANADEPTTIDIEIFKTAPDVVLNCIGLIKQSPLSLDIENQIYLNALFPNKLAKICKYYNTKLIHFSTDCVFNGKKGNYKESDPSDAEDIYGKTKYLGEVDCTIRTSIIGHSAKGLGLIDWFLSQKKVKGYANVMYSGLPTIEIARIVAKYFIPLNLKGVYNVSGDPISKYTLLKMVNRIYKKDIEIEYDCKVVSDRTLDSSRFRKETGYTPPSWEKLIHRMYEYYKR
jgi:dTDP-4-dehydrorhamnose reductase